MDLLSMVARVKSGDSSLGTIDAEINTYKELYAKNPPEDKEEFSNWADRRFSLARQLDQLVDTSTSEKTVDDLLAVSRVSVSAAALLGANDEMKACSHAGTQLFRLKAYKEAVEFFDYADRLYDALTEPKKKYPLANATLKPECLKLLHRYYELEQFAQRLIAVLGEAGPFYTYLGIAKSFQGDHAAAIEALNHALRLFDEVEPPNEVTDKERALAHSYIGLSARAAGDYEGALAAFESARRFALKGNSKIEAAFALSEQGITWSQLAELGRAKTLLTQAAAEAESLGYSVDASRWLAAPPAPGTSTDGVDPLQVLVWAGAFLRQVPPNTAEARRLSLVAMAGAQELGNLQVEAEARNTLAQSYSLDGRHSQSVPPARRAVELAVELGDKTLEMTFRTNFAIRLRHDTRIQEAEKELRIAIELGRELRKSAQTTEFRQTINAWLANTYDVFSVVLAREWHGKDGNNLPRRNEALIELGQEIRASNFARWIAAESAISKSGQDDLRPALLALRAAEVRLEMYAIAQRGDITPLLEAQKTEREKFAQAVKERGLDFEFVAPTYSVKELGDSLPSDHYVLDLYAGLEEVFATLIKPGGAVDTIAIPWNRPKRIEFIRTWQSQIFGRSEAERSESRFYEVRDESFPSPVVATQTTSPSLSELIAEWNERFIVPIAGLVKTCRRLTIVPHRELSLVPYWLIDEHVSGIVISLAPGVNIFKLLRDRFRKSSGQRLALGDATHTLRYVPLELRALPEYSELPNRIDSVVQSLANATLLHVAGHGQFNERNPYLAGMVMEPPRSLPTKMSDRPFGSLSKFGEELLTVGEVLAEVQLPNCFLTVLSACCTGLPRQHPASEFIGLPAAFLIAGANNVIASLWPVHDGATCIMMQEFYQSLFKDGSKVSSVSAAMADARKNVSRMPRSEVVERLGSEKHVPHADLPYNGPKYTLAFQHYGID